MSALPSGVFRISIDDGFVEYRYDVKLGGNQSINSTWQKISKALRKRNIQGVMRRVHGLRP